MTGVRPLVLPQELVNLIVDELEDDPEALETCSLINHTFSARAREHIFYTITISTPPGGDPTHGSQEKRCRELHELLLHQPTLPSCIHSLTLVDNSTDLDGDPYQNGDFGGWLTSSNLGLATIIASLTSLETISIRCESGFLNWNWLSKDLQLALNEAFLRPSISDLRLENIVNFKIGSLAEYSHLKHLRLHHVHVDESEAASRTAAGSSSVVVAEGHAIIELEHLDVADCGVALDTLLSRTDHPSHQFDIIHIRRLSMDLSDFGHNMVSPWNNLLASCGKTVEEYHVTQQALGSVEIPSSIFAFSQFPRLRAAKVALFPEYWQLQEHDELFPALWTGLYEFEGTSPQLAEFCVEVNIPSNGRDLDQSPYNLLAKVYESGFWSDLDCVFSQSGFQDLVVVHVVVNMRSNLYDAGGAFLSDIRMMMLRLYHSTKLKLSWHNEYGES